MIVGLKRGTVRLTVHQEGWVSEAENTIQKLKELLGDAAIDIQHIGSTAISSIHAKPIIDIVIGVRELNDIHPYINVLNITNNIIIKAKIQNIIPITALITRGVVVNAVIPSIEYLNNFQKFHFVFPAALSILS